MPHCDINLAKGVIWSRKQRLLAYRLLMLYLGVMILLLLAVSSRSVQQVFSGIQYFSKTRDIAKIFAQDHPQQPNIHKHADELTSRLKRDSARIDSINSSLPPALHTPLPALVLLLNQSGKVSIQKMAFAQQTEEKPVKLLFDLITPQDQSAGRQLQDRWLNDPYLSVHFPEIKQLQVRRSTVGGEPVLITQYEAIGKE